MNLERKILLISIVGVILASALLIHWFLLKRETKVLRVSTTTSLYATGLLDKLAEEFKKEHPNVVIQFIAVGSGEALRKASQGDADMVLVHAPGLEKEYMDKGVIIERKIFAYNYFIIVGPKDDPAGIRNLDPITAMKKIYMAGEKGLAIFVSRGDNSGTHERELLLWSMAGLNPEGKGWYKDTGSGMAQTLMVANNMPAYTLSDIGTFLKLKDKLTQLDILVSKGDIMFNIYSAYIVAKSPNRDLAREFINYLISSEGQKIIGNYGVKDFGQSLFYPASSKPKSELIEAWKQLSKNSYGG
ncbi:MAG: extracellular solute-binding protein [Thermoproteales archaeon]|nr:extracellular solute-binding protein [Thermoproteales archaeon]